MDRPIMNPSFVPDEAPPAPRVSRTRRVASAAWRGLKWGGRAMLADLNPRRRPTLRVDDGLPPWRHVLRGVGYRLVFAPIVVALLVASLVFAATHPPTAVAAVEPVSVGVYYDPVTLLTADGVRLDAWIVPVVDAGRIVAERNKAAKALHQRYPAVVLAHDYGASRQQMMPWVKPLHEAGFVVVVLNLRGCGTGAPAAATFGIHESLDVKAAVEMLRRRSFVNGERIGVLGVGTGATAALLAAEQDSSLGAVVLDRPVHRVEEALASHLDLDSPRLSWMVPLCKWAFEIGYGVDADKAGAVPLPKKMEGRPVLVFDGPSPAAFPSRRVPQVVDFLRANLVRAKRGAARAG